MRLIVQKFGGTSVADLHRIRIVAAQIKEAIANGNKVIAVVSAMAGVTNQLVTLCNAISLLNTTESLAEYDAALCSGEIVTSALVALSLQEQNIQARSVLAWQLPLITSSSYGCALVNSVNVAILKECLQNNIVPVVAGFQGISRDQRHTTLGRGGSDITASVISAAMQAERCDIYTDVEGVFTADPRVVQQAKKLERITFEEMLCLSASGAKVLHPRCVEIAMRYNVTLRVLSSFANTSGTLITVGHAQMEDKIIVGITANKNLLKLDLYNNKFDFSQIYTKLLENNIHIDMIINLGFATYCSFILQLSDKRRLELLLRELQIDFVIDTDIAMLSVVGYGLQNDQHVLQQILAILDRQQVAVLAVQLSRTQISLLVSDYLIEEVIRTVHEQFISS